MKFAAFAAGAMVCLAAPQFTAPAIAQTESIGDILRGAARAALANEDELRTDEFAQLPYWPGYWVSEDQAGTTITGQAPAIRDNFMSLRAADAAWNEEGRRRWDEVRAAAGGRKATGWGYPMMMNSGTPWQVLITPEEVLFINAYNEARHIYTDGRAMPDEMDMWPTTYGTSIGHWEGDTLVIETMMVETPSNFFHGAPPFSEDARYTERLHMEGDRLVGEFTVADPATLDEPFTANVSWVREEGFDRMIVVDWTNDRTGNEDGLNTIEAAPVEN